MDEGAMYRPHEMKRDDRQSVLPPDTSMTAPLM